MVITSLLETLVDQYKVEQHVREKQYTDVYQAYDVDDNHMVWLDIVREGYAGNADFTNRFTNRAKAIAQVRHPNIARVYHVGKTPDGAPYAAQAHVDGISLAQRLDQLTQRNNPVNSIYALKLVRQLADALLLGERLELFHYDLQPDNIYLKNVALPTDDTVMLIDLFIPSDRKTARLNGKASNGSAYQSPEQRAGRELTSSGHIYSLGVLLFRLLVGSLPSSSVTLGDTLMQQFFRSPTSLARARPGLSAETYRLVDRCLRRDAGQRFSEMEDLMAALDSALQAEERLVGSMADGSAKPGSRTWRFLLPFLLIVLFLVVGAFTIQQLDAWPVFTNGAANGVAPLPTNNLGAVPGIVSGGVPVNSPTPDDAYPEPGVDSSTGVIILVTETSTVTPQPTDLPPSVITEPSTTASNTPTGTPSPTETSSPTQVPEPVARVAFNLVNLRQGPGVAFPPVQALSRGQELIIVARTNDTENIWLLVDTEDGRRGWVSSTVVDIENETILLDIPLAATYPPPPTATSTATTTPTATPVVLTATPTLPSVDDSVTEPTSQPPQPPADPTLTPPPLP
jgi:serine/threonine protein kinase